jgi:cellulose synthase/poly-beta-1,6-N-acetylglucosamine synthase-like glycosyltransferase
MAHIVFWLSAGLIGYIYLGYPMLLWLISLFIRASEPAPSKEFSITLMITAHNEESSIEEKLRNTLALNYPRERLQILVVSDGSSDATDSIVKQFVADGVELIRIPKQLGKTHAQNIGVQSARGDLIVFSDATTHYVQDALSLIAGNYTDPRIGAVSGRYLYIDSTRSSSMGSGAQAYAGYDNTVRHLQSKIWSITGCCGCIYSVRRSIYTSLSANIISDLVQPLHVLKQGFRVVFEPRAIASESSTSSPAKEFSMRARVITRALRGFLSVSELLLPWRFPWIAFQIWSHKLLRFSIPLFLLGMFSSSAALLNIPMYRAVFGLQILFYAFALLASAFPLHHKWRPLGVPLYFCTINAAAVAAVFQLIRGQQYTVWSPERVDRSET